MALAHQRLLEMLGPDHHVSERRARAVVRSATGAWIRSLAAWTHFGTLTFQWATDESDASQMLWVWLKQIARFVVREHVRVAWAVERGKGRYGRVHLHVLLALPTGKRLSSEDAFSNWWQLHRSTGFIRLRRYTEGRGGPWYLIKTDSWDWGTACPKRFARCKPTCAEDAEPR